MKLRLAVVVVIQFVTKKELGASRELKEATKAGIP
jgi:hypothetical protein